MYLNWEAFAVWCGSSICSFSGIFNPFKIQLNLARQSSCCRCSGRMPFKIHNGGLTNELYPAGSADFNV